MPDPAEDMISDMPDELRRRKLIISGELADRTLWFIRLRWWVPPSIILGTLSAGILGVKVGTVALFFVAGFMLAYNAVFLLLSRRVRERPTADPTFIQRFTYWQVALDYSAMFLLIHFTGGAASPLIFFFIFHIIFASILLPERYAYACSTVASAGMALIAGIEYRGLIEHHALFRDAEIVQNPSHLLVELGFFTASVFITAFSTTAVMSMLKKRIVDLADLSEAVTNLNNKLQALYAMIQAIGTTKQLDPLLNMVTSELAAVMDVKAISVKLLGEDNKTLRYASFHGLPDSFLNGKVVEVEKSPINRGIIEGEPFITGRVTQREMFQFGEDLAQANLQSVLFVPLVEKEHVIGILGAYCTRADRFKKEDVDFFKLAAGLVAIALENARAYVSVENLINERSKFMMRVAHNLRAPLAATISILEVLREGYKGDLNPDQKEYLRRIDRRARTMLSMINELMTLSQNRSGAREFAKKPIDLNDMAGRIQRTFQDEAAHKNITFQVVCPDRLPKIMGDPEMIEQVFENFVSNAIKYTPAGGRVGMAFSVGTNSDIRVEVSDNGIGIAKSDITRLFTEFFRAENAKTMDDLGTGLGLAIVKNIVDKHGGRILVESEEGLGSIFVVHLPIAKEDSVQRTVDSE